MDRDEVACCENLWCGQEYAAADGWDGFCPSCVALFDEHLAQHHGPVVPECVACRRAAPALSGQAASA